MPAAADPQPPRIYGVPTAPVLLVGEAPNRAIEAKPRQALVRPDLMDLCGGIDLKTFVRCYRRCNLLDYWPGKDPHVGASGGDVFPAAEGAAAAARLIPYFAGHRVVLLGRRVETAVFGRVEHPWFTWFDFEHPGLPHPVPVAVAPHPSGINRYWNVPVQRAEARAFWVDTTGQALIDAADVDRLAPRPLPAPRISDRILG